MRFDDILEYLGEFGTYQKRLYFLLCIPLIFCAFHKLGWVFLGAVPDHRCRLLHEDLDGSPAIFSQVESLPNATIPWDDLNQRWSRCDMFVGAINSTEVKDNHTLDLLKTKKTCDSWVYDKSQYHSTVVTEFNLVCHRNWLRALAYTFFAVGDFLGAIVIGSLSDRIGRRKVLILSLVGEGITGVLVGLIHNYYAFIILRMMVGMFTQAELLTGYILGLEFVGPSKRVFAGIVCNFFFAFGYLLTAALAYFVRDWYYLQISLSVPVLIFCICIRWIPESARWLLSVNKNEEAMAIIQKAAKVNKIILPPEAVETDIKEKADILPQAGPIDLVRTAAVRKIVFVMGYAWFVNSAVYYGLSLNTSNLGGNDYFNFLIAALLEFPAYTVTLFSVGWFGRRLPTFLSMAVGGAGLLAIIFVPPRMTTVIITLAMVGKFCITVSYSIVFVFAAELVPTQVRNVALGVYSMSSRVGSMITPFILLLRIDPNFFVPLTLGLPLDQVYCNPVISKCTLTAVQCVNNHKADYWSPLPLIVLGAMTVSSGLLVLVLPETHGKALPETMMDVGNLTRKKNSSAGVAKGKPIQILVAEAEADDNEMESELKPMVNSLETPICKL